MKKTLITKLGSDVSMASEAQIEAIKEFYRATFTPTGLDVSFEVIQEDEKTTVQRLLHLVRSEFKDHDEQH